MKKYLKNSRGVTLVELLLAMTIASMVLMLSYTLYFTVTKISSMGADHVKVEQDMRLLDYIFRNKIRNTNYLQVKNDSEEIITIGDNEDENIANLIFDDNLIHDDRTITRDNISDIKIQLTKVEPDKLVLTFTTVSSSSNKEYNLEKKILLNNLSDKDIVLNEYQTDNQENSIIFQGSLVELNYINKEGV